ncbi:site-specific integrase [Bradyrhizobium sp. Arg62]|uniref:tyrosine-type recombinase/integrase n=1 Tax=Bradyrhizobium brasilense TaxID=1419277 RepID=UPI001E60D54A|nr:site-specific integrase [Bradyrhizobium brasilense]MCC8950222.1 site-specific integrase [Bradyrhizobium brasilense]
MAYMIMPCREKATALGIAHHAHVPMIWTAKWKLADEAVDYLIARGTGMWRPGDGLKSEYATAKRPSANSMYAFGRDIEHFLTYCERRRLDWRTVHYVHLLETYQADMETGAYSARKRKLAPATINRRMCTVGDFLTYAAKHGLRVSFEVEYETIVNPYANSPKSRNGPEVARRAGRVRDNPDDLRLPTRAEIKSWLDNIETGHRGVTGITAYLMCRTVIETGMRAEELILFRADQLPDPDDEKTVKPDAHTIGVEICFGTKGGRRPEDPEQRGKLRKIAMDREFVVRLHDYKRLTRLVALKAFRAKHPERPTPKELFLSPHTGEPYSYRRFNEYWVQSGLRSKTMPFPGWSPHGGRHAWACYEVLERLEAELKRLKMNAAVTAGSIYTPSVTLTDHMARNLVDQFIRPVLGHVSEKTTERYLRWLQGQVGAMEYTRRWSHWLDRGGHG